MPVGSPCDPADSCSRHFCSPMPKKPTKVGNNVVPTLSVLDGAWHFTHPACFGLFPTVPLLTFIDPICRIVDGGAGHSQRNVTLLGECKHARQ